MPLRACLAATPAGRGPCTAAASAPACLPRRRPCPCVRASSPPLQAVAHAPPLPWAFAAAPAPACLPRRRAYRLPPRAGPLLPDAAGRPHAHAAAGEIAARHRRGCTRRRMSRGEAVPRVRRTSTPRGRPVSTAS
ncbi:hypothetical protein BRADI_2g43084v3 [Brachypodium distachyon]|uniref:Uncharacterized protein n=1 Tax=Brachypodium distachyon TaxID=15368 RepID=A0A2K2DDK6_BRADI|nr:hypothetical protein BRADI_2g43084v3 [Brachypodium distachyon]